jgi:hypothetical protein
MRGDVSKPKSMSANRNHRASPSSLFGGLGGAQAVAVHGALDEVAEPRPRHEGHGEDEDGEHDADDAFTEWQREVPDGGAQKAGGEGEDDAEEEAVL